MTRIWLYCVIMVILVIVIIYKIFLDKEAQDMYTPLHQHMCFERQVKEPWETEPLGRIEQVGIHHVLVTAFKDRHPLKALDAYSYGWVIDRGAFDREYKEVSC